MNFKHRKMSSLCAHSLISTYKIAKLKTTNFIWLTFCIQLFKYATSQTSQTLKVFKKTSKIFICHLPNFSNLLHHKPPIIVFSKFQSMPLSFTKQIKYFEHSHSSFQISHIINHLQYMPHLYATTICNSTCFYSLNAIRCVVKVAITQFIIYEIIRMQQRVNVTMIC
jgi:hypothetical protein